MTLFDHYLEYMTQLMEGRRTPPEGITLPEGGMTEKAASLSRQLQQVGTAAFVRACARQDGVTLPEEIYRQADDTTSLQQLLQSAVQLAPVQEASPAEEPSETAPDPDAGKHAFEVFLDCVALDDGLVQYLMEVLQKRDWKEFYKLSQITTKLDLDPGISLLAGQQGALRRRGGALLHRHHGCLSGAAAAGGTAGADGGTALR